MRASSFMALALEPSPQPSLTRGRRPSVPQVASGAFVSKDRDSALKTLIYLAASRFNPDAEEATTLGAGGGVRGDQPRGQGLLRKISLTAVGGAPGASGGFCCVCACLVVCRCARGWDETARNGKLC